MKKAILYQGFLHLKNSCCDEFEMVTIEAIVRPPELRVIISLRPYHEGIPSTLKASLQDAKALHKVLGEAIEKIEKENKKCRRK